MILPTKIKSNLLLLLITVLIFSCIKENHEQKASQLVKVDSLISNFKSTVKKNPKIISNLYKAEALNTTIDNDSIKLNNLLKIAYQANKTRNYKFFLRLNEEAKQLSLKLKDTSALAKTHKNKAYFFSKRNQQDSAYYHYNQAVNYYELINDDYNAAKSLYDSALILKNIKYFTGSESKIFLAIEKFKKLNKNTSLFKCYSLLGLIYKDLKEYDQSIVYYKKAREYLQKSKSKNRLIQGYLNNIALTYRLQKNYKKAIFVLNSALTKDKFYENNPKLYAKILDNLTYNRLLNNEFQNVEKDLKRALKIREHLNNKSDILASKIHLSEYYLRQKDTTSALKYSKECLVLAKKIQDYKDHLKSLKLLSKIDKKNSVTYLNEHLKLNDSINSEDRKLRNKFVRIRFETDQHIKEADKQASQKLIISGISVLIIIILSLIYFVRYQRGKNRELKLETEQQRANENIYNLLLKQQAKLEEGQLNERKRIAQELHDGVLGRLFATRMRWDFLDIEGDTEILKKHELYLNELQNIEKEIRVISHELKSELLNNKYDFTEIITHLVHEQSEISNYEHHINIKNNIEWHLINDTIKINYYRIIQETLQNINKHAKAKNVVITLALENEILSLQIKDDGIGFDTNKIKKGIGLLNISDRVKKLKGTFILTSTLNKGSILSIQLPLQKQ